MPLRVPSGQPVLLLTLVVGCAVGLGAQPSAPGSPEAVVLVTTFADGRTSNAVVTRDTRSSWTPVFPRLPGWRPAAGEATVTGLKFTRTLQDDGTVSVRVAVLRGVAREREDAVAEVVVAPRDAVTVEALRAAGVAPVTLSLTALADTRLHQPQVVNRTAGLEVTDIELVMTPRPQYRISVTNVTTQPAVNFHFVAHRDGRRGLSGNRGNPDARPIIAPGGTYSFNLGASGGGPATAAGWAPLPHDVIEIAAVLWEDGSVEGDVAPMAAALSLYLGGHAQISRGLGVLRVVGDAGQPAAAKARLKAQLERLPIEPDDTLRMRARERLQHFDDVDPAATMGALRTALADTRQGMIDDLAEAPDDAVAFQRWLVEITALYEQWRDRFATR
jgi:hypothetical protein